MTDRRALVVGGGITGLTAALDLADGPFDRVELWEADDRTGGKLRTSAFAGIDHVDEGADAYLVRVPHAAELATHVGLTDIVSPTPATAAVWHGTLHDLPEGLLLGLPARVRPLATTSLLSWRGKLRAALEPLIPTADPHDSLGALVRRRFGDEVHERLVDALVGSIYAADTDRWSLATVPQLSAVAADHRSLLLAARRRRGVAPPAGPVFGAPATGMGALADAARAEAERRGVVVRTATPANVLERDEDGWRVDDRRADVVVMASPAPAAARLLTGVAPDAAHGLATIESADVIMVRLVVGDWPERLHGRSGYLVPKPEQRYVTAASFASQKWAHWQPPSGGHLLRVSLGRDGLPVLHLDDDAVLDAVTTEVGRHLDLDLQPESVSITRWAAAFPQYRPHHLSLVARARAALPAGIALAGAAYDGIGVPACIASAHAAATHVG